MTKRIKIMIVLCLLLFVTGCTHKINQDDGKERIYLSEKFYNKGEYIKVTKEEILSYNDDIFVLFTYNNYCNLSVPCDEIFATFMKKYGIDFLSIPYEDFKETIYYDTVKFAPSVLIIDKSNIVAYLDAESDDDLIRYTDADEFEKWLNNYIYFTNK